MIKGNITSLLRTRDQTVATLYNEHAKVNSMTNCGSSQPGESINQIISQIIQRDRSAVDDHSADIFGDDQRLFISPANNAVGDGSDTGGQQQSSSTTIPETGNNATNQLDSRGEFEALQLLTQYIGPRKTNPLQTNRHGDSPSNLVEQHMSRFKEVFLEKTDKLDRARNHLDSLTQAVQKNRIPNKLRINVKPLVIDKENPTFVRKWNDAIRRAELELTKNITEHLQDVIQQTNAIIRENIEKTYHALLTSPSMRRKEPSKRHSSRQTLPASPRMRLDRREN